MGCIIYKWIEDTVQVHTLCKISFVLIFVFDLKPTTIIRLYVFMRRVLYFNEENKNKKVPVTSEFDFAFSR